MGQLRSVEVEGLTVSVDKVEVPGHYVDDYHYQRLSVRRIS